MTMSLPNVVFVLGGPGVGKGTQCAKIVEAYSYVHLSAGELLRGERASGSKDGDLIEHHITNGTIVPVEITCRLLENAMNKVMKTEGKNKFLVDGFPRNEDNLQGWEKQMGSKANVLFVLFFDGTEQTCLERALERGKNSGRSDDNIESLQKRFRTYTTQTMPIIEHFAKLGKVKTINSDRSTEEIFADVKKIFDEVKV